MVKGIFSEADYLSSSANRSLNSISHKSSLARETPPNPKYSVSSRSQTIQLNFPCSGSGQVLSSEAGACLNNLFAAVSTFARNYRFHHLDLSIYVRTFRVWMVNYPMIGIED
ncbi:hypothetical protein K1719_021579 [Acacia pycnantha]|nr:hypothetical protein K1719_041728 [Acacia pycnantha]KAI9107542.1 hypothetical protein K1719_021579 [Acacia pycnantha]